MARLTDDERRATHRRLKGERLRPVPELAPLLGRPAPTVERWIVRGHRGLRLDGLHRPGKGWLTSREACLRFAAGMAAREG